MTLRLADIETLHPYEVGHVARVVTKSGKTVYVIPVHWAIERLVGSQSKGWLIENTMLRAWWDYHSVHYYARPRDSFDMAESAREAAELGKSYVLAEDLS